MVADHSRKARAREIMANAPWLSLTEAKELVPALGPLRIEEASLSTVRQVQVAQAFSVTSWEPCSFGQ